MFKRKDTFFSVLLFYIMFSLLLIHNSYADQIVTDGKTQTTLTTKGCITDVHTQTIRGSNAFNSFSKFDVYNGNVVNLHLPNGAENLLNFVHDSASNINGVLNSIRNGKIGGNVYLMNPNGISVGSAGVINVGSLTMSTPNKAAMLDAYMRSIVSDNIDNRILEGTLPLNMDATILIEGKINVIDTISIESGQIDLSGKIYSDAIFESQQIDFSDVVNVSEIQYSTNIQVAGDGSVSLVADPNAQGSLIVSGSDNSNPIVVGPSVSIKPELNVSCEDLCTEQIKGSDDKSKEENQSDHMKQSVVKNYHNLTKIAPIQNSLPKVNPEPVDLIKYDNGASLSFYHKLGNEDKDSTVDEGAYIFIEKNK